MTIQKADQFTKSEAFRVVLPLSLTSRCAEHRRRNIECFRWLFLDVNQFPQDSKNQRRSKNQLLLSLYDEVVK